MFVSALLVTGCSTIKGDLPNDRFVQPVPKQAPSSIVLQLDSPSIGDVVVSDDGEYAYVALSTDKGKSLSNEIHKIHLRSKKRESIFKSDYKAATIGELQVNANWMVWSESRDQGSGEMVWARNQKTGVKKKIYQQRDDDINHIRRLSTLVGDSVIMAYETQSNKHVEVKRIDLNTFKEKDLVQYAYSDKSHDIKMDGEQDRLIWTDFKDGTGMFQLYDLKSGKQSTITDGLKGWRPGYVRAFNQEKVLFQKSEDMDSGNATVFLYDLNKKTETLVIKGTEVNQQASLDGNSLFFTNESGGVEVVTVEKGAIQKWTTPHAKEGNIDSLYTSKGYFMIERNQEKEGRSVSTSLEFFKVSDYVKACTPSS